MYVNARQLQLATSKSSSNTVTSGATGGIRAGTALNDVFHSIKGDSLVGGAGDDIYNLWDAGSKTVETSNQGVDTVYVRYYGGIKLADNIENVFLVSKGASWAKGNALDNVIVAGDTGARLNGGRGDDVLVGGRGADIFEVSAGNGSEAIVNFRSGWDVVKLDGYGVTSFAQLAGKAQQIGSDVRIELSPSEILVLRDVRLGALQAADFGLPMGQTAAPAGDRMLTGAGQAWNANGWYVVNNAWGANSLRIGPDYSLSGTFHSDDMTKGTTFNWSFAHTPTQGSTVLAYPEVIFGLSPMNTATSNPSDKAHVFPVKVGDIVALTAEYDVSFKGNTGGFNVSYDIWLTKTPNGGRSSITNEIMVWVHAGDLSVPGTFIGTYVDGAFSGRIYHTGTYTAVVADIDVPLGTLDVAHLLLRMQELGVVSPNEYLGAIELGAEVVSGVGSLTINDLELRVETRQAGGGTVVDIVTGAGTTVVAHGVTELAFDAQYAAGSQTIKDAFGHTIGTEVTTRDTAGAATSTMRDLAGNVTGSDVVTRDATSITTRHSDGAGNFSGSDRVIYASDGSVSTQHYDTASKLTGAELTKVDATGVSTVHHYDAAWRLVGADRVFTETGGAVVTQHYDGAWKLTGSDRLTVAGNTSTTQHYDARFALTGTDKVIAGADGNVAVQHYDANWKLASADLIKVAGGSTTTMHYDGGYKFTGQEVATLGGDGVTKTLAYDGSYKLQVTSFDGTDRADALTGSVGTTEFHGGLGSDRITGGTGIDRFYFDTLSEGDVDTVANFSVGKDKIMLDNDVFAGIGPDGALSASQFAVGSRAPDASTHLFFDTARGDLFYDADGSGAGHAILIAHVVPNAIISASDFIVF